MSPSEKLKRVLANSNRAALYSDQTFTTVEVNVEQVIEYRRLEREIREQELQQAGLIRATHDASRPLDPA